MTNITPEMLTAYALDELPTDDAPAVEAHLAAHPDARAFVDEVRANAERLTNALQAEPLPASMPIVKPPHLLRPVLGMAAILALGILFGVVASMLLSSRYERTSVSLTQDLHTDMIDTAPQSGPDTVSSTSPAPESPQERIASDQARATDHAASEAKKAREKQVNELLVRAKGLQKEMKYDEAIDNLDQALWLDPNNVVAKTMKGMNEDAKVLVEGRTLTRGRNLYRARLRNEDAEANVPYTELVRYPADWPELTEVRLPGLADARELGVSQFQNAPAFNLADSLSNEQTREGLRRDQLMFFGVPHDNPELSFTGRWREAEAFNRDAYDRIEDNPFLAALDNPLSTFSVDVDTAGYANVRRYLNEGALPPPDAVRIEEMVNYFSYDYDPPSDDSPHPFAAHVQVASCPWNERSKLVRIGLKGKGVGADRPDANLVFLIDVSGSMNKPDKLPLVKSAMKRLTRELRDTDRVAIVVYAGASGLVLDSTPGSERHAILDALDRLTAGGSTNGAAGIELAYATAEKHKLPGAGVNRVILCTDGDFNVGVTDRGQLTRLIEEKATSGVYLSVLGFGRGNLQDATMEELSNKGDGNYAYCDSLREAQRVLIEQMAGTLVTIAKDVKLQVEFNPAKVAAYRLIGYENRVLAREDFNNDEVDAGDIGSGHTVTALYEVVPVTTPITHRGIDDLTRKIARLEKQIETIQSALFKVRGKDDSARVPQTTRETATMSREQELQDQLQRNILDLKESRDTLNNMLNQPVVNEGPASPSVDDLKYLKPAALTDAATSGDELLTLKLRYKAPDAPKEQGTSTLVEFPVTDADIPFTTASNDTRFAASVAAFGMLLRGSPYAGTATLDDVAAWATAAIGEDKHGDRAEFITLVHKTKDLAAPDRDNADADTDNFQTP